MTKESDRKLKEDFCPSCLIMPLSFVGTGAMVAGSATPKKMKKWRRGLFISGIVTLITLFILIGYYFFTQKNCNGTCKI
jgi:uncharacterized membrane protein AbrB (regulator of aidB expression)